MPDICGDAGPASSFKRPSPSVVVGEA